MAIMRRCALAAGVVALAASASGCHLKDTFPYNSGEVLGGNIDLTHCDGTTPISECAEYELKLRTVAPHNQVIGWQPVDRTTFNRCERGEEWRADRPGGCPAGVADA